MWHLPLKCVLFPLLSPRCYLAVNIDSSHYSPCIHSPRAAACCFIGFALKPAATPASLHLFNLDFHPRKCTTTIHCLSTGISGLLSAICISLICFLPKHQPQVRQKQTTHWINTIESPTAETRQFTQKQSHNRVLGLLWAVARSLLTSLLEVFLTSVGLWTFCQTSSLHTINSLYVNLVTG